MLDRTALGKAEPGASGDRSEVNVVNLDRSQCRLMAPLGL
jgi:hypothetical protein